MTYLGTDMVMRTGDRVRYAGNSGTIVFVVDDDTYSEHYPRSNWSYLGSGLGIELDDGTLYHLDFPDEDLAPEASA